MLKKTEANASAVVEDDEIAAAPEDVVLPGTEAPDDVEAADDDGESEEDPTSDSAVEKALADDDADVAAAQAEPEETEAPVAGEPVAVDDPEIDLGDNLKFPRSRVRAGLEYLAQNRTAMTAKEAAFVEREKKIADREAMFAELGGIEKVLATRKALGANAATFDAFMQQKADEYGEAVKSGPLHPFVQSKMTAQEARLEKIEKLLEDQQAQTRNYQERELRTALAVGVKQDFGVDLDPDSQETIIGAYNARPESMANASLEQFVKRVYRPFLPKPGASGAGTAAVPAKVSGKPAQARPRMGPATRAVPPRAKRINEMTEEEAEASVRDLIEGMAQTYRGHRA